MKKSLVERPSQELLERIHALEGKKGMMVAIEPETGKFFLGKTTLEAFHEAKREFPGKKFYFVRVGYPAAHWHKGGFGTA